MTGNPFKPEDIARQALARLRAGADPIRAAGAQAYFKDAVKCYGVTTPDVRSLAADIYSLVKDDWTVAEAVALCDILYEEPHLESKAVGTIILIRFRKSFPKSLFAKVKGWLAADLLDNWASVDILCPEVVGALIVAYPDLEERIRSWSRHPNRWVKRASAVSFIKLAKREEYRDTIYAVASSLFPVDDDLIQKANGWLLRETGKKDMPRLEKFLLAGGPAVPRTTLRYAIERFEEGKRKDLLARTRG
ncbi:MAG: DNA alkylation repair protein [Candidatus Aminicenantales bacterium]